MNTSNIFSFLRQLAKNNNREWFNANKELYLEVKHDVESLINIISNPLVAIDSSVKGYTDPSKVLFRIYRDVRFSKDKQPYKTHFGCCFAFGGKSASYPCYYLHLEPENSLVSGGVWCPTPQTLKKIRQEIFYNSDEFMQIVQSTQFKEYFSGLDEYEMLKKNPLGFPSDFKYASYLRYKHYTVSTPLTESLLNSEQFVPFILKAFSALKPLNDFLRVVF